VTRALVLAGGGSKGAWQAGVIDTLVTQGYEYPIICGISVGAINGAFMAQFPVGKAPPLWTFWQQVNTRKIWKRWFVFGQLSVFWRNSAYDSYPIQQWLRRDLSRQNIQESGRQLRVVSTSWDSGEVCVATEKDPNIIDWIIASSAFPCMLTPVVINGQTWTDGGLRSVTPLGEAIRAGATDIDMVLCSNPYSPSTFSTKGAHVIPQFAMRAIDIMSDQVARGDLQIALLKNEIPRYKNINIRTFEPLLPLDVDSLQFDPPKIKEMYDHGARDAVAILNTLMKSPLT
jgi:NTE family protein